MEDALYLHSCEKGSPDKFSIVRNVNRVWFSLACLPRKHPGSCEILTRMNFNLPDFMCICYGVNGALITLLTSPIYKHRKRAATHLFKRPSENQAFFSKLSNFHFHLRPPG